jgi:ATP-binding protein involved in chromosome partitioning
MMRVAIPICEGVLTMHFGHCEKFALVEVDPDLKVIVGTTMVPVIVGAPSAVPEKVVMDYLAGSLVTGANVCDH